MTHFVSASAGGPCSMCGADATHKVGEEIPPDEPCMSCGSTWQMRDNTNPEQPNDCTASYHRFGGAFAQRHNLTAYVCCKCFTRILGPATGCPVATRTTVMFEGREWILLQPLRHSDDGKMVGYSVLECGPGGSAKLPAVVHYIEFPTEKLHGNDA